MTTRVARVVLAEPIKNLQLTEQTIGVWYANFCDGRGEFIGQLIRKDDVILLQYILRDNEDGECDSECLKLNHQHTGKVLPVDDVVSDDTLWLKAA